MRSPCCLCVLLLHLLLVGKGSVNTFPRQQYMHNNRRTAGFSVFYVVRVVSNTPYVVTGDKSVCIRKALRPAISTQVFCVFLYLQENSEMVRKLQVDTACFSCSPPDLS
jgi:hypothetical protein